MAQQQHRVRVSTSNNYGPLRQWTQHLFGQQRVNKNAHKVNSIGDGKDIVQPDFDKLSEFAKQSLMLGEVINLSSYDGVYRVKLDNNKEVVACTSLGRGLPFATSSPLPYTPHARVIVFCQDYLDMNIILGTVADLQASDRFFNRQIYAHNQHLWHRLGVRKNEYQKIANSPHPTQYFADGVAIDSTSLGDFTKSNYLGSMFHLSSWQAIMKMTPGCGIWMNLLDELMRLVAKNLQIWTPAGQINKTTAGGETLNYDGQGLYEWENIGYLKRPTMRTGEEWMTIDKDRQTKTTDMKTVAEPKIDTLTPFFRFEQHKGWFGHGGMMSIKSLPDIDLYDSHNQAKHEQLLRQSINVSGTYTLEAAGGFALERTFAIPCYQQLYEPFETEGDSGNEEYTYCGDPEDEVNTLQIEAGSDIPTNITRMSGVIDYYIREKYKSLYAFIQHTADGTLKGRDYIRIDERLNETPDSLSQYVGQLTSEQFVAPLKAIQSSSTAEIFPEVGNTHTEFVIRKTGIYTTQDGGLLFRDAYGNEIRTGANGIEFKSISDITVQANRRIVNMAGDDYILNANKSIDITALQNDVRISAFNNLEAVGGISGKGRTLLENRSEGELDVFVEDDTFGEDIETAGLFLVSKNAANVTYTKEQYTQCTNRSYLEAVNYRVMSKDVAEIKAAQAVNLMIGVADSEQAINKLGVVADKIECKSNLVTWGDFVANRPIYAGMGLYFEGAIQGKGGIQVSGGIESGVGISVERSKAAKIAGDDAQELINERISELEAQRNENPEDLLASDVAPMFESEGVAHAQTATNTRVKSRTVEQYGSKEYMFLMPDSVNETNFGGQFKLSDFCNKLLGQEEGPFPGKTRWNEECCLKPVSAYKDKKPYVVENENEITDYAEPELVSAQANYPAIVISN